jgi:hypothetical protein
MELTALQTRLRDLVAACPLLAGRPVLIEEKGNLVSELETALSTQSLAVVIAPASGQVQDGAPPSRAGWEESFDVVIHRGLLDDASTPTTVAVLDQLRAALHGAPLDAGRTLRGAFAARRHELRENGDGSYARALTIVVIHAV